MRQVRKVGTEQLPPGGQAYYSSGASRPGAVSVDVSADRRGRVWHSVYAAIYGVEVSVRCSSWQFNKVEFGKEAKYTLGPAAPAADTPEGLREIWKVVKAALIAVAESRYAIKV